MNLIFQVIWSHKLLNILLSLTENHLPIGHRYLKYHSHSYSNMSLQDTSSQVWRQWWWHKKTCRKACRLHPFIFTVWKRWTRTGLRIYITEHIWRNLEDSTFPPGFSRHPSVPLTRPVMLDSWERFSDTVWEQGFLSEHRVLWLDLLYSHLRLFAVCDERADGEPL